MKQRPDVYVCSKPLQYFNIKNIGEVEKSSQERILIFVGAKRLLALALAVDCSLASGVFTHLLFDFTPEV